MTSIQQQIEGAFSDIQADTQEQLSQLLGTHASVVAGLGGTALYAPDTAESSYYVGITTDPQILGCEGLLVVVNHLRTRLPDEHWDTTKTLALTTLLQEKNGKLRYGMEEHPAELLSTKAQVMHGITIRPKPAERLADLRHHWRLGRRPYFPAINRKERGSYALTASWKVIEALGFCLPSQLEPDIVTFRKKKAA